MESLSDLDSHSKWLLILSCLWPTLQVFSLFRRASTIGQLNDADSAQLLKYQMIGATVITVYQLFVIYGTICMRKRTSYRWARVAAWMGMVPGMGMCLILAVPYAWMWNRILTEAGVRESFASESYALERLSVTP